MASGSTGPIQAVALQIQLITSYATAAHAKSLQLVTEACHDSLRHHFAEFAVAAEPFLDLVALRNPECTDEERYAAAKRLAGRWGRRPIAPQRLQALGPHIRRGLVEMAGQHGRSPKDEFNARVQANLFQVGPIDGSLSLPEVYNFVRRKLNDLVTEDLMGPGWRHRIEPLGDDASQAAEFSKVEAQIAIAWLARHARLSERETRILILKGQGATAVEIACHLGMTPGAVRVVLYRIKKKIKGISVVPPQSTD